jgi:hypothetical protein
VRGAFITVPRMNETPPPQPVVPKGCGVLIAIALIVIAVVLWKKYLGG